MRVKIAYRDLSNQRVEMLCQDLLARCVLHEIDHLNGVLFIDRMSKVKRALLNRQVRLVAQSRARTLAKAAAQAPPKKETS